MRRLDVSPAADLEAEDIFHISEQKFGAAAAERYRRLLEAAYRDLVENPQRAGVTRPNGVSNALRLYPIRHSRARLPAADRVGEPRHVIAFRFDDETVQIIHLLHDGMDLPARLR